jgi:hypothetical protein
MPAVMFAGPMKMLSASWLAITEATATRVNRVKRTPTLVRALRISAAPIRLDASAIDVLGYVTDDRATDEVPESRCKVPALQATASARAASSHDRPPSRTAARYRVATASAADAGSG